MSGDKNGDALSCGLVYQFPELTTHNGIHTTGGLIQENDFRTVQNSGGESQFLLPTQRNRSHQSILLVQQHQFLQTVVDTLFQFFRRNTVHRAEKLHILENRQVIVQRKTLAHVADMLLDLLGLCLDGIAANQSIAGSGQQQSAHHLDGSGLSRTIRPQEAENFPLFHLKIDVVDSGESSELLC